jgi:hypothetical protein
VERAICSSMCVFSRIFLPMIRLFFLEETFLRYQLFYSKKIEWLNCSEGTCYDTNCWKHTLKLRGGGGGELVSETFGYFSHCHRLTKLTK